MEYIREVQRWGNSAGILLPKELLGKQIKVIVLDRTLEIKKEIFRILEDHLEEISGIYLCGSYARGEEDTNSDIDIIAVSKVLRKEIKSGKYNVSIIPYDLIMNSLKKNPILILPRLIESKVVLNSKLLEEFLEIKLSKGSFQRYYEETERIININKDLLDLENNENQYLDSNEIIYSLILRLRGLTLIECILNKKKYSNKSLYKKIKGASITIDPKNLHNIYRAYRDNKTSNKRIKIEDTKLLINLIEKTLKSLSK